MGSLVLIQAASKSLMQQFGAPERRGSSSRSRSKLKYIITPKQHHSSSSSSSRRGTTVVLPVMGSNWGAATHLGVATFSQELVMRL